MRKYITRVSMRVNSSQKEFIEQELKKLGYNQYLHDCNDDDFIYISTNYAGVNGEFASTCIKSENHIDSYNPELFLALAAMSKGEKFYPGEYVIRTRSSFEGMNIGDIDRMVSISGNSIYLQRFNISGRTHDISSFRKLTKEGILAHFNNKTKYPLTPKECNLPAKWAIEVTEESKTALEQFLYNHKDDYVGFLESWCINVPTGNSKSYFHYPKDDYAHSELNIKEGYTEITFEQFKQYNMEKQIIGYKLIKPEYESIASSIGIRGNKKSFITSVDYKETGLLPVEGYSKTINNLKEAGVLDPWFEPVYEEEKPRLLNLGSRNVEIILGKENVIEVRGHLISIQEIKNILNIFNSEGKIGPWSVNLDRNIQCIRVGCREENNLFSLTELELVVFNHNKINKII